MALSLLLWLALAPGAVPEVRSGAGSDGAPEQAPALVLERAVELAPAVQAWAAALEAQGLGLAVDPGTLLRDDHIALPRAVVLPFRGRVVQGFQELLLSGEVELRRLAPGRVYTALRFTGATPPGPRVAERLLSQLQDELLSRLPEAPPPALPPDPLLSDPERCRARIAEHAQSPFPEARQVLEGALDQVPPACRRPLTTRLLQDPAQRERVVAWLAAGYRAAPEAERAGWCALMLQVPDLPPELEALIAEEERRQQPAGLNP